MARFADTVTLPRHVILTTHAPDCELVIAQTCLLCMGRGIPPTPLDNRFPRDAPDSVLTVVPFKVTVKYQLL
jgi:hypothetical protein